MLFFDSTVTSAPPGKTTVCESYLPVGAQKPYPSEKSQCRSVQSSQTGCTKRSPTPKLELRIRPATLSAMVNSVSRLLLAKEGAMKAPYLAPKISQGEIQVIAGRGW